MIFFRIMNTNQFFFFLLSTEKDKSSFGDIIMQDQTRGKKLSLYRKLDLFSYTLYIIV